MGYFEAVLFDFDGVIVDSTPIHLKGWAEAYLHYFNAHAPSEVLSSLVGQSTLMNGTILAEHPGRPEMRTQLTRRKSQFVLDHLHDIPLIPGSAVFLERLTRAQIPFGVCSNAPRAFIEKALNKHGLELSFFLGLEDYDHPKPHPEPYLKGAQRIGWVRENRQRIAVFEDSVHGIHAAVAAGMTAIGVSSQHPSEELLVAGATHTIIDFTDGRFLDEFFFDRSGS